MCNWNSAHLGDVFQYIKDPTPHDDNDAHFAWKKRWAEAYKEAQWWIKIGSKYYKEVLRLSIAHKEVLRLSIAHKRAIFRIADLQYELSKYEDRCAKCKRGGRTE